MDASSPLWAVRVGEPSGGHGGPTTYRVALSTDVWSYEAAARPIEARRRFTEFVELRAALAAKARTVV